MCDEWMPFLKLPLTLEQFKQLPRNAAYKYEYIDGLAYLSPRARHYHALLDLQRFELNEETGIQCVEVADLKALAGLLAAASGGIQPYGGLDDRPRREAAQQALERVRAGGD